MEPIELIWQGPFNLSNLQEISDDLGIYIHSICTEKERIWYVGESRLRYCQVRHLKNLKGKNNSTINLNKMKK